MRVPSEYGADDLEQVLVRDVALRLVVTLGADLTVAEARAWLASGAPEAGHQGFPLLDGERVVGVLTRRDLQGGADPGATLRSPIKQPPVAIGPEASLREAADRIVRSRVGRPPVLVAGRLAGMVTRSDLLDAHQRRSCLAPPPGLILRYSRRRWRRRAT